jgi:DNA topoisomerase-1
VRLEILNSYMDGKLVLELKEKGELRGDVQSFKPEEAAVLALLRGRLANKRPAAKKAVREVSVALTRRPS